MKQKEKNVEISKGKLFVKAAKHEKGRQITLAPTKKSCVQEKLETASVIAVNNVSKIVDMTFREFFENRDKKYIEGIDTIKKPTKNPPLSEDWVWWRLYGYIFYQPLHDYVMPMIYRSRYSKQILHWLHGSGKAVSKLKRYWLYKLLIPNYHCPHCGFENWLDESGGEYEEYIDGGTSYGEFTTHHWEVWKWCYLCGYLCIHSDST